MNRTPKVAILFFFELPLTALLPNNARPDTGSHSKYKGRESG